MNNISRPIEERLVFGMFDIVQNKNLEDEYRIQAMELLTDAYKEKVLGMEKIANRFIDVLPGLLKKYGEDGPLTADDLPPSVPEFKL